MKILFFLAFFLGSSSLFAQSINSPNSEISVNFALTEKGIPTYELSYKNKPVILTSQMGFELQNGADLFQDFEILDSKTGEFTETWNPVWGEYESITDRHNFLSIYLKKKSSNVRMNIHFKVFNDGVGFRYEFPRQPGLAYFTIAAEKTEFRQTGDHTLWYLPGDWDTNEYNYYEAKFSGIDAYLGDKANEIGTRSVFSKTGVQTPLMIKSADGLYINIHEAALLGFPAMHLEFMQESMSLEARLAPDPSGARGRVQTPFSTPWRTVLVSDDAREILSSTTILNLNPPSEIENTEWIKPQKYVGIWWEMHVDKSRWNYSDQGNLKLNQIDWDTLAPNGKHGATTENTKRYLDFAAEHGFDAVLVEGWYVGWEDWYGAWKEEVFDFVTPYPDFDVEELSMYAKQKGVKLIMHHETSASVTNYERRMDEAFQFMKKHGYDAVKSGYVGRIIPRGEFHDGQWMVEHFERAARKAADYEIMVNMHESVRLTGLHRTFPNWLASEAARGNEFNAWSSGNLPYHETVLPFTRLMGGPMDYTPGIFQIILDKYRPEQSFRVHTTLAKQLALYVTLYSPIQMAADLPENYERFLDAFQFIKDVGIDWSQSLYLEAEPGDYVTIARKEKGSEDWFLGAITDENGRTATAKLDFLNPKQDYEAIIYADAKNADWESNPMAYEITKFRVDNKTTLKLKLANGGGAAVSIRPIEKQEAKGLKKYK